MKIIDLNYSLEISNCWSEEFMRHHYCPKLAWAALLLTPVVCFAQAGANPFAGNAQAAADGQKLFVVSCAPCHGKNGEGAQGQVEGMRPPDLTRGVFKAGRRDEDLFRVISDGVRGTEMQSFKSLGADQIWRLVVFIRTLSIVTPVLNGNPVAGEALFWGKGDCGRCHQIGSRGSRLGPDLARGGRRSNAENLKKAIVDPNADITPGYAIITVITRDGKKITGLERWLDNFSTRLVDESGNERTFLRDEVTSVTREMRSTMPENYGKTFSDAELNDLVAYIVKTRSEVNSQ
jgi:putative heme-binding domain-containing protein